MQVSVKHYTYKNGPVPVYTGGRLTLHYATQSGRFNLLSSEESLSCHVEVRENGRRLVSCNISPDYEYRGTDCDEAVEIVEADIASHWIDTARAEKQGCLNFIKRHQERIEYGNAELRMEQVLAEIRTLTAELDKLAQQLTR